MPFQLLVRIDREDYTRPAAHIKEREAGAMLPLSRRCGNAILAVACLQCQKRGMAMYARVTSFKVDPARLQELSAKIEEMGPRAKALPGIVDAYAAWRGDGQGVVVAIYRSKEDADRAVARIQALWGDLAGLLSGAPKTDAYETAAHVTA